jgi:hypothetical protein
VDDLFVLNRFLPTTGQLIHYLDVRQQVAGIPSALLFDELDHLGAYISRNRFDSDIREQVEEYDRITWDSFSDIVDQHFNEPDWELRPAPSQSFPEHINRLLHALDRLRPSGWLAMDTFLRDFGGDARDNFSRVLSDLEPTLSLHPNRNFIFGEDNPLQVWVCRQGAFPTHQEMLHHAEVGCLVMSALKISVLLISHENIGQIAQLACHTISAPSIFRTDFSAIQAEAARKRAKLTKLRPKNTRKGAKNR